MANFNVFNKAKENMLSGVYDFNNVTTINAMIVQATPATTPADNNADPKYGPNNTPSPDFSLAGNEVDAPTGGSYTAGGSSIGTVTLSPLDGSSATTTVANGGGTTAWAQHASNPTEDANYVVIYDDAATDKEAIAWIDLGQTFDMVAGTLTLDWGASLFTLA